MIAATTVKLWINASIEGHSGTAEQGRAPVSVHSHSGHSARPVTALELGSTQATRPWAVNETPFLRDSV